MDDDLKKVAEAIALGRNVLSTVKQNILVFAVCFNALGVLLAGAGIIHPVGAAVLHNIGSIAVVLNSARLIFRQGL